MEAKRTSYDLAAECDLGLDWEVRGYSGCWGGSCSRHNVGFLVMFERSIESVAKCEIKNAESR
jgi:hypothetical protein